MKLLIFLTSICLSSFSFSQNLYFGDLQAGLGVTKTGTALYHGTGGFNAAFGLAYFRLGADVAFGGDKRDPSVQQKYSQFSLRLGINNISTEKMAVRPYIGVAYQSGTRTTDELDVVANAAILAANLAQSAISTITEGNAGKKRLDTDPIYLRETYSAIIIPIGVDFYIHSANKGFMTGFYVNCGEYSEVGLRMGFTFGKLR